MGRWSRWLFGAAVLSVGAVLPSACGSSNHDLFGAAAAGGQSPDGAASGGGSGVAGTGGSGAAGTGGSGAAGTGGSAGQDGGGSAGQDGGACPSVSVATQVPLDIYVMLDISGSMTDGTAGGQTKWAAVQSGMAAFLNAPESQGLGVGIQYFPITDPSVPSTCTSSAQCGNGGICALKTCSQNGGTIVPCDTDADCVNMGTCIDLGISCSNQNQLCAPATATNCSSTTGCARLSTSYCSNQFSCSGADYATPAVEITTLGSPQALIASINSQSPNGSTPTGPALQGAIDHATAWASAHSGHRVIVVLATDGMPTVCSPTDITQVAQIAATGLAATPSVTTFAIGVFSPSDTTSQQNLDTIATSGGSGSAFIIDTTANVGQQFTDALDRIRRAMACEFALPDAPDGGVLDYSAVKVSFSSGSQTQTVKYVGQPASCDPTSGGWFYDVDPASGGTPTKIIACNATCAVFEQSSTSGGGQVVITPGC